MADKLLIAISGQGATAAHWRGGRIVETRSFPDNETGQTGFKDFLAGFSNIPVYIVVDAIEEDYRFETLPHAFGRDRADMVNRKLRQHYRNTPYMSATLLGRDTDKRRDDRYLFSALTNPELINDWVQSVVARGTAGGRDLPAADGLQRPGREARRQGAQAAAGVPAVTACGSPSSATASSGSPRLTRGDSGRPGFPAGRCRRASAGESRNWRVAEVREPQAAGMLRHQQQVGRLHARAFRARPR